LAGQPAIMAPNARVTPTSRMGRKRIFYSSRHDIIPLPF
jgi:hypothetical protein